MKNSLLHYHRRMPLLLLMLFILVSSGCAKIQARKRADLFKSTLDTYSAMIRWGNYKQAGAYIKMRDGEPQQPDLQYLKQIHVTRYDIVEQVAIVDDQEEDKEPAEISVTSEIDYYHDSDPRVKSLDYQQLWWYDDKLKKWFLDGDLPGFQYHGRQ